jgi:hypothetical protein
MTAKLSRVFRAAKKILWDGDNYELNTYICHAIERTNFKLGDQYRAKKVIQNLLEGEVCLEQWLWEKHRITGSSDDKKIQQTRHAWLNHLIKHYESIGD